MIMRLGHLHDFFNIYRDLCPPISISIRGKEEESKSKCHHVLPCVPFPRYGSRSFTSFPDHGPRYEARVKHAPEEVPPHCRSGCAQAAACISESFVQPRQTLQRSSSYRQELVGGTPRQGCPRWSSGSDGSMGGRSMCNSSELLLPVAGTVPKKRSSNGAVRGQRHSDTQDTV